MELQDADASDAAFGARIRNAVFWRSGSQIVAQVVSWCSTLAVVRILEPSDYGLFAMAQVILNFMAFLNGYGLISALVQSDKIDPHKLRQAFGLMLLLNGALAAIQLALAPLAASYYEQPLVADLLRVQALIYLATPFISVPEVVMGRSLDFRRPAVVNLATALMGAIAALVGALSGWGVWTLVIAPIVAFWTKGIGNMIATRMFILPSFDFRGTGPMILFGASLLGSQLFWIIQSQADVFIGGRMLDPHQLGLYTEALFLTQIFVSRFIPPLNDVAFPAYARMQNDPAKVVASFSHAIRLLLLIACPVYFGMAAVSEPLVATLFGPKWLGMAPFITILALAMPFLTIQVMFAPVTNGLGRPGTTARISAIGAALMPAAFLIGIQFGAFGLAWAWIVAYPILLGFTIRLAGRPIGINARIVAEAALPPLICAATMGLIVAGIGTWVPANLSPLLRLALLGAIGAATYVLTLRLWAPRLLQEAFDLVVRRKATPAVA